MDNLTICKRCGSDACYTQDITPEIQTYFCYGCGFQTNTLMKVDSDFLQEQLAVLPDLYKSLMGEEEEKTKYPIPGKKGEYYEFRMDMSTIKHFEERDFMDALSYIEVLPE